MPLVKGKDMTPADAIAAGLCPECGQDLEAVESDRASQVALENAAAARSARRRGATRAWRCSTSSSSTTTSAPATCQSPRPRPRLRYRRGFRDVSYFCIQRLDREYWRSDSAHRDSRFDSAGVRNRPALQRPRLHHGGCVCRRGPSARPVPGPELARLRQPGHAADQYRNGFRERRPD